MVGSSKLRKREHENKTGGNERKDGFSFFRPTLSGPFSQITCSYFLALSLGALAGIGYLVEWSDLFDLLYCTTLLRV